MLAKLFHNYNEVADVLILASGVSDSKETKESSFMREYHLIYDNIIQHPDKAIIYFSTSSMYDPLSKNSPYVNHKLAMEKLIIDNAAKYYIFRISQVIGRANNPTLVNFIIEHILKEKEFDVWSRSTRNLIAIKDVFSIIDYMIKNKLCQNSIVNIANSNNIAMPNLIEIVELVMNKKANCKFVPKGYPFDNIDISKIKPIYKKLAIDFSDENYYLSALNAILSSSS